MIWLNPWAWLGVFAVAVPVLIHLFGRGPARVVRFPTLRFIQPSRLLPARRTRIHDALVLAVRVATIVAAVAALARPFFLTKRRSAENAGLARAIVIDTSASMHRQMAGGGAAIDSARRIAKALAADAEASIAIEAASAASGLRLATGWAERQSRRTEVVIIADFPTRDLDSMDVAGVPAYVGLSFREVQPIADSVWTSRWSSAGASISAERRQKDGATVVTWSPTEASADSRVTLSAGATDARALAALRDAAAMVAVPIAGDSSRRVEVVFARAGSSMDSLGHAYAPWMLHMLAQLRVSDIPVIGTGTRGVPERLVVVTSADPISAPALRLVTAARRASSPALRLSEIGGPRIPRELLASWQRPPSARPSAPNAPDDDRSDGRWFWIAALALLGIEYVLRRRPTSHAPMLSEERARAA
jgi:hypothetical protein